MPGNGPNSQMAVTYPTNEQYERWKDHADNFDMSVSGFIANMVEAGMKKFDAVVEPDATNLMLREQRDDMKSELDHARTRIRELEEQLHHSDWMTIREYVEDNPGANFNEITDHLRATVPQRTNLHLAVLEGDALEVHDELYYPVEETERPRKEIRVEA